MRNIEVVIPAAKSSGAPSSLVVGAHYDSDGDAPGANDNGTGTGTGTAAVIELARLLKDVTPKDKGLRLVLFVNEEAPYYRTDQMGSLQYSRRLKERGERVASMTSLETIGFFSDAPGSQKYSIPFGLIFPSTANFISFVAMPGSRTFLHEVVAAFRRNTKIPTIGGTAPDLFEGIAWSDHWSFWHLGYPAVMVTDTALYRYPHYHTPEDTPEKVDYEKLARITIGLEKTIRDLL
ncbi:MAG: M28 family peptidase [Hyphomicrobium sp.]|nr:M28 family peptidase [Hyphomicrobium sp.]